MLFEIKNLEKSYYDLEVPVHVLRGLSFNIKEGEFVSIMGPSGSGKSTLLHILGFLDTATGGACFFDGRDINDYEEEERAEVRNKKMGFIFQTFNLLPRMNVLENVKLPLLYSKVSENEWERRAKMALESVGMGHRLEHDPMQLSGGERQRVAIARALVNKPDVIFADEPTGNLDSKSGEQVMDTIAKLHKAGHTVILITHETYTANYADRVIRLLDGKIDREEKTGEHKRTGFKK